MTPQEKQLLESLANRIAGTAVPQKDPEADALIRQTIGTKPDALYILTQTALIQEMALNQANQRLHDLQQQINVQSSPAPQQHQSFLGRLFGPTVPTPPQGGYYQDAPQYQQAPPQSGAGSFLRSAATTATGVAAGALAFEGIESLIGGHHGYGGFGGGSFGGGGEFLQGAPQETTINNYYDDSGGRDDDRDYTSGTDNSDVQNTDYDDANGGDDFSDNSSSDV